MCTKHMCTKHTVHTWSARQSRLAPGLKQQGKEGLRIFMYDGLPVHNITHAHIQCTRLMRAHTSQLLSFMMSHHYSCMLLSSHISACPSAPTQLMAYMHHRRSACSAFTEGQGQIQIAPQWPASRPGTQPACRQS